MKTKLTKQDIAFLSSLFAGDALALDRPTLSAFSTDASGKSALPFAIVRPENVTQISRLLAWANHECVPLYTRSRASNKVGDTVPVHGGIVVSMLRMNKILDIDTQDFVAEVQPGVITADLAKAVQAKGLFYPPDPASARFSSVGGNIATCAGGLKAVKYGVTRDYVLGIEAVLPSGQIVNFGSRCHKDVVGLDLARLFVGSTGNLGVLTRCILKLLPFPAKQASLFAVYARQEQAIETGQQVLSSGILPAACEFMGQTALQALYAQTGLNYLSQAGGAMLFQVDGSPDAVKSELACIQNIAGAASPLHVQAGSAADEETVWAMRRQLSQACFRLGQNKLGEDIAIPRGKILEAVQGLYRLEREHGTQIVVFGHFADGNLHVNTMYNASDIQMSKQAHACRASIVDLALSLGGTASGEHGLGLSKKKLLSQQIPNSELALMRQVKAIFDPRGIMNPGKEWE